MWLGIIITLALGIGLAKVLVDLQSKEIINNWKAYRCLPQVMTMAGIFKPADDPRSSFEYTADNFSFCSSELAKSALNLALKPVFDVFYQMMNTATQSIGFTMNLRTLASNMFSGLNRMFDVFNRRFGLTLNELQKGFIKQYNAIQKASTIANAAVFAGISFVQSIMNFIKLIVTIVIVITVILIVIAILFFWILAPITPLILSALIVAGAFGGAVGNMAESFCFTGSTQIVLKDETVKSIDKIQIGDVLFNGSVVTACMNFESDSDTDLRLIDDINVSGSHIIYDSGPIFVKDHKLSKQTICFEKRLYCLNTSDHKIPVKGASKIWYFADWEELDKSSMSEWALFVNDILNGTTETNLDKDITESESGFDSSVLILCENGEHKNIADISIGTRIKDGDKWTKVIGVVTIDGSESLCVGSFNGIIGSCSNWIFSNGKWIRAIDSEKWTHISSLSTLHTLFTESGSFSINDTSVRDFSEVGLHKINKTYNFTFSRL